MAEVAIPSKLFTEILRLIAEPRPVANQPSTLPGNVPAHCSKPSNPANAKTTSSMQATLHPKMITL
jgi:hypothetical protein